MIRKILLAGAACVLTTMGTQAADIVEPMAYDWSGPYVGLQGGYAWGDPDASAEEPVSALLDSDPPVIFPPEEGSIGIDGFVGGIHAGHNWQSDSFVFGIEGDAEFADIDGDTDVFLFNDDPEPIGSLEEQIDWLASLRLRAGFAWDRTLIYATGGLAVGGAELTFVDNELGTLVDEDKTLWGYTIGGGLEFALSDALSARVEYRWTDLGDIDGDDGEGSSAEADVQFHAVRAGISWHFGQGG
jgi:outer membrane immunogenic protein